MKAKSKSLLFIFFVILVFVLASSALAQTDIPIGLQKIIDFNAQNSANFAVKVSFFIAFIAGILGILSPCILPFLPAYFSYTFKEKKNITKMTLVFFMGFSLVFVAMGIVAGFIGSQTLLRIQSGWLVTIAGVFMILLGIITLRGKKVCFYLNVCKRFKNDISGTFLFGMFFAIGWTACLGPILAGILGIGALLGNIVYSAVLMLFYSLGNLVPLFILAMLYDRFNLGESRFIRGKNIPIRLGKREYNIHSTNLISAILFFVIGFILIIYKGTAIVNMLDIFGTKSYFYSIQRQLIEWQYANILGFAIFSVFIVITGWFLWKYKSNKNKNKQ